MAAPKLVRLKRAAEMWGIATSTLHQQVREGTARLMPCLVKPYRWREEDIERDIKTASYTHSRSLERRRAS